MIDADGFTIYTCSECHTPKMAALFTPQEIDGFLRCRVLYRRDEPAPLKGAQAHRSPPATGCVLDTWSRCD